MTEKYPWDEEIDFAALRIIWISAALLLFPSLLLYAGLPKSFVPLTSTSLALPACAANCRKLGIRPLKSPDLLIIPLIYGIMILLTAAVTPLWQGVLDHLQISYSEKQDEIFDILSESSIADRLLLYLSVCIITPFVEEILFRRMIYSYLAKINRFAGILLTSSLFSLAHFFIYGIPGLLIMGLGFQFVFLWRKNLLTAIVLHSLVNSMVFAMHFFTSGN